MTGTDSIWFAFSIELINLPLQPNRTKSPYREDVFAVGWQKVYRDADHDQLLAERLNISV